MPERITSRANPLVAALRRLASSGAFRRESGRFLCDSPKLLREALQWGAGVDTVVYTAAADLPPLPSSVRRVEVPEELMAWLSPMKTPQGVVFTCPLPSLAPPPVLPGGRYAVLDGVQDPGNVGTVLRTLDAFEGDGVILLPGCADPFGYKAVRASMGAVFRRPVYRCSIPELSSLLGRSGLPLYGAALRQDTADVRHVDLRRCAVAIGAEGQGLSEAVLDLCEKTVRIPMSGRCESLNAAAAAAVLLWEGYR